MGSVFGCDKLFFRLFLILGLKLKLFVCVKVLFLLSIGLSNGFFVGVELSKLLMKVLLLNLFLVVNFGSDFVDFGCCLILSNLLKSLVLFFILSFFGVIENFVVLMDLLFKFRLFSNLFKSLVLFWLILSLEVSFLGMGFFNILLSNWVLFFFKFKMGFLGWRRFVVWVLNLLFFGLLKLFNNLFKSLVFFLFRGVFCLVSILLSNVVLFIVLVLSCLRLVCFLIEVNRLFKFWLFVMFVLLRLNLLLFFLLSDVSLLLSSVFKVLVFWIVGLLFNVLSLLVSKLFSSDWFILLLLSSLFFLLLDNSVLMLFFDIWFLLVKLKEFRLLLLVGLLILFSVCFIFLSLSVLLLVLIEMLLVFLFRVLNLVLRLLLLLIFINRLLLFCLLRLKLRLVLFRLVKILFLFENVFLVLFFFLLLVVLKRLLFNSRLLLIFFVCFGFKVIGVVVGILEVILFCVGFFCWVFEWWLSSRSIMIVISRLGISVNNVIN